MIDPVYLLILIVNRYNLFYFSDQLVRNLLLNGYCWNCNYIFKGLCNRWRDIGTPVWSKKHNCRIKLTWHLKILEKVPIFQYCAYQVYEHAVCIQFGLLKMGIKEHLCKRIPYFRSFPSKAYYNHRIVGDYMSFIWLRSRHEACMFGYKCI